MKKTIFTVIIVILTLLVFLFSPTNKSNPQETNLIAVKDTVVILPPTIDEIIESGIPINSLGYVIPDDSLKYVNGISYEFDSFYVIKGEIKEGDAITNILKEYHVSSRDIYELKKLKNIFDIGNIQSEKKYTIICSKDSNKAKCFVYHKSKIEYFVCDFRDTISVRKEEKEKTIKTNIISGTIQQGGGLWYSISKQLGEAKAPPLVDILANNIYGWSIDFFQIQSNDSFIVYFEEEYVGKEYVGIGKVFAASFTHKGKTINAFRFKENESFIDYFDEKGNNLRSAFLKSPIDFARVSSSFGNRKHPISGKWKKHKGTDYAAATGTKIMTTASGTVTHASRKGGYGNCVIIKHNDKYSTLYAHLSKYQKGVRKGSYVKQGDIIGYVGSTGYATGPHLHYEFMVHGNQVNPYKQELPPSLPLKKENTEAFEKIRDEYIKVLDNFVK